MRVRRKRALVRFDDLTKDIGHISDRGGCESQGLQRQGKIRSMDPQTVNVVWLGRFGILFTCGARKRKKKENQKFRLSSNINLFYFLSKKKIISRYFAFGNFHIGATSMLFLKNNNKTKSWLFKKRNYSHR